MEAEVYLPQPDHYTNHMIRVLVNGAKGKMGSETVRAVQNDVALELVGESDQEDDLQAVIKQWTPDVVVDFTRPDTVKQNAMTIIEGGACPLIGTTGLSPEDLNDIDAAAKAKNLGAMVCPNFAIGAVLMMKFSQEAAKHMRSVEIVEYHHDQKLDAPSGTAIKTAEMIVEANPSLNAKDVPIHSVRLPGFVAHQEVIFGGLGQRLTLRHDTINRESFMPGVVLAIKKIQSLSGLVYGLEKIL